MRTQDKDVKGLGRVVRGQVSASGGIVSGSGFSVAKTGTGTYVITFATPFRSPPDVIPTTIAGFVARINAAATANQVQIDTLNQAAAFFDNAFEFFAIEGNPA